MKIEMQDEERHELYIKGSAQTVWTGRVPNGWWWDSPHFTNPDGVFRTREAALAGAKAEIAARLPN